MNNRIIYTKYSNDRADKFCIRTQMVEREDKKRYLMKSAEYDCGSSHIRHIAAAYEKLTSLYKESRLKMNRCFMDEGKLILEYLEGYTLEEELDNLLESKKIEQVLALIKETAEEIHKVKNQQIFHLTEEFKQVFGNVSIPVGLNASSAANIDMIFPNIVVNAQWNVIDYEWTFLFPIPINYIVFRAVHYYIETAAKRWAIKDKKPYEFLGITKEELKAYEMMEVNFQKYIHEDHISLGELYHSMGESAIPITDLLNIMDEKKLQIYYDMGQGFQEDYSMLMDMDIDGCVHTKILVPDDVMKIRIDPAMCACIVEDLKIAWDESFLKPAKFQTNGVQLFQGAHLFETDDPNVIVLDEVQNRKEIFISYKINLLKKETAEQLSDKLGIKKEEEVSRKRKFLRFFKS